MALVEEEKDVKEHRDEEVRALKRSRRPKAPVEAFALVNIVRRRKAWNYQSSITLPREE